MDHMKFLFALFLIPFLITPAFAETSTQTLPTEKGTLDVKLSYEEIVPGELTTLKVDFINPIKKFKSILIGDFQFQKIVKLFGDQHN